MNHVNAKTKQADINQKEANKPELYSSPTGDELDGHKRQIVAIHKRNHIADYEPESKLLNPYDN